MRLTNCPSGVELSLTIILSCIPGIVSAWRNMLRDTTSVRRIRLMFRSEKSDSAPSNPEAKVETFKVVINDKTVVLNSV